MENILALKLPKEIIDKLLVNLLPKGYHLLVAEEEEQARQLLFTNVIKFIIGNLESRKDFNVMDFLKWIREIDEAQEYKFICLSQKPDEHLIKDLTRLNVSGLILSKLTMDEIVIKITNTLDKFKKPEEEMRQHVRIKVAYDEQLKINFPIVNTDKHVNGYIRDISFGGLAFEHAEESDAELYMQGQYLNNVILNINEKTAIVRCQVVVKKQASNNKIITALKFIGMNPNAKTLIARYIHEKLIKSSD